MTPALLLWMAQASGAPLVARCSRGCLPGGDQTPSLLYHDADQGIVLEWSSTEDPGPLTLRAGDPMAAATLPSRGPLLFVREQGLWRATAEFSADTLKAGTLVTALLDEEGRDKEIAGWWVWRPLTPVELDAQARAPEPWAGWELGLAPAAIRIETGGRALPVGVQAGKVDPWWAPGPGEAWTDVDLDGAANGAPGLGVSISPVWASRADDPAWRDGVGGALADDEGQAAVYDDLRWTEAPTRSVEAGPGQAVELRAFYAVLTLQTQASAGAVDRDQLQGWAWRCGQACLTHETSAVLKVPDELPLWSDYNPRLHSQDPELLRLLQRQVDEARGVPGLDALRRGDGDGGETRVDLGLMAALQPWTGQESLRPGIVAIDVVGSRAGVGVIHRGGRETPTLAPRLLTRILGGAGARELDLADLPDGWSAWGASARVLSQPGLLRPMGALPLAQKGAESLLGWSADELSVEVDALRVPRAPASQRVVVSAALRAGALVRRGSFGRAVEIVPVNVFAQVVLRVTVAAVRDLAVAEAPSALPGRESVGGEVGMPETRPPQGLAEVRRAAWVLAALTGLGLLAYALRQVRTVVGPIVNALLRRSHR